MPTFDIVSFSLCCAAFSGLFACSPSLLENSDTSDGSQLSSSEGSGGQSGGEPPAESADPASLSDVCRFQGSTETPLPKPDGTIDLPAQHPFLWYSGRLDCDYADGPRLSYPGSAVRVKFRGTGLLLRLRDHGKGGTTNTNYYETVVDGGEPLVFPTSPSQEVYPLAEGLPEGEHEVVLGKRIEASPRGAVNAGTGEILGFTLQGTELLRALGSSRRLEFIGDSITCGYGNQVSTQTPDDAKYTTQNSNGRSSYGALTAQLLSAEYLAVAYSGKGMSRNYGGGAGPTVPEFYLRTVPDDMTAPLWDTDRYQPDAVIVNVGTNDFSTLGVDRAIFVEKYAEFLGTLRTYYPSALFVAAIGPMLVNGYPAGTTVWTDAQADIQAALALRSDAGDTNTAYLAFAPQTGPWGEDWHPSQATHQKMADQLSALLKEKLGW